MTLEDIEEDELEPAPLLSEVEKAVKQLKIRKSPGLDGLPASFLKAVGPRGMCMVHKLCTCIWKSCTWPDDWKIQECIALFEAGDTKMCQNYRTIALISHINTILLLIILKCLKAKLVRELPENQAAYRKGRGTRDMLVSLQIMIETVIAVDQKAFITFID